MALKHPGLSWWLHSQPAASRRQHCFGPDRHLIRPTSSPSFEDKSSTLACDPMRKTVSQEVSLLVFFRTVKIPKHTCIAVYIPKPKMPNAALGTLSPPGLAIGSAFQIRAPGWKSLGCMCILSWLSKNADVAVHAS